jgi:hypothetical protein
MHYASRPDGLGALEEWRSHAAVSCPLTVANTSSPENLRLSLKEWKR